MKQSGLNRRNFFRLLTAGGVGSVILPGNIRIASGAVITDDNERPFTNVGDALKYPKTSASMPGLYPGKVAEINHGNCIQDGIINEDAAYQMVKRSILVLTGEKDLAKAWRKFVNPGEKIGLKVNPVAGKMLSTSVEIVKAIARQITDAGILPEDIVIWDRRAPQLEETGFTPENFPGNRIMGTEHMQNESWYDENGKLHGEKMIDKNWYYFADVEGEYDEETLPYMINQGKYSYFSKICTEEVDKIINIPILKNAGASVTLCLKNLAYGAISNTGRLHQKLWADTCAEVCAFPPLRDKVVLNIVDGIKGCFNGGPGANPQFITNFNTVLAGTDPVAVDTIGYEIILKKRIAEKIQEADVPRGRKFLELAEKLELGFTNKEKIEHIREEIA